MAGNATRFGATYSYRRRYHAETLHLPEDVRALELLVDHFLPFTKARREELAALRDRFMLIPHSLDVSLGSADGPDAQHLAAVTEVLRFARPAYWSEHVAFTRIGKKRLGHLAPLPFTEEAVATVVRNIATVQARIDTPLLLENISYPFYFPAGEYDEFSFLAEICRASDADVLLDLANLNSAAQLRHEPIEDLLERFDPKRVRQLHLAGGFFSADRYVDSHDCAVSETSWRIVAVALRVFTPQAIVIERDDNLPIFSDIVGEIARANAVAAAVHACH